MADDVSNRVAPDGLVDFDRADLVEVERSADLIVWRVGDSVAEVILDHESPSFWSELASEPTQRSLSRRLHDACAAEQRGVVDLAILEPRALHGARILSVLLKQQRSGADGLAYDGVIALPLRGGDALTISVTAEEGGVTGLREAAVLDRLRDEITLAVPRWVEMLDDEDPGPVPWRPTHADTARWDAIVPDHPLSIVRRVTGRLIASLRLQPWTAEALLCLPAPGSGWV